VLTARMTTLHFAATPEAAGHLAHEGICQRVWITGNTGIDAVLWVRDRLESGELSVNAESGKLSVNAESGELSVNVQSGEPVPNGLPVDAAGRKLILVTAHRRESFGEGFDRICEALLKIADRQDVHLVYPVHPNPNVRATVDRHLRSHPRITLVEPMDYVPFVDLMRRAHILLTDSGGIQEEGPSLGKPVLVMREKTERPEAVAAGTVKLVGTDVARIVSETAILLDDPAEYQRMSRIHNPYGDGHASERIEAAIRSFFD